MSIQPISTAPTALPALPGFRASDGQSATAPQASPALKAAENAAGLETSAQRASADDIGQALDEVRTALAPVAQNLLFSIDDDTGKTVIRIIDSSTDEVIKQIPSEEILAIAKALDKLQGLLIKQEA